MIFVTVGTTMPFDKLIYRIDELKGENFIKEDVVCQIGNGKYIPVNCEYFRFKPSIEEHIDKAFLIIAHGGTGTVFSFCVSGIVLDDSHTIPITRFYPRRRPVHRSALLGGLCANFTESRTQRP